MTPQIYSRVSNKAARLAEANLANFSTKHMLNTVKYEDRHSEADKVYISLFFC